MSSHDFPRLSDLVNTDQLIKDGKKILVGGALVVSSLVAGGIALWASNAHDATKQSQNKISAPVSKPSEKNKM